MGRELIYIITPNGNYLPKQRKKSLENWTKQLVKLLHLEKYSDSEIEKILKCYRTNDWYANERFYKKPYLVVDKINELYHKYDN